MARGNDMLRVKTKHANEIRRFSLVRKTVTFATLLQEIARIHNVHPAVAAKIVTLKKYKSAAASSFTESDLAAFLESNAPQLALSVEIAKAAAPAKNAQYDHYKNASLPKALREKLAAKEKANKAEEKDGKQKFRSIPGRLAVAKAPRPWPKTPVPENMPEIIKEKPVEGTRTDDEALPVGRIDCFTRAADALDPPPYFTQTYKRDITVFINGEKRVIRDVAPDTFLAQYLRTHGVASTKIGCGEGGCGACTVVLSFVDPISGEFKHVSTNSCMRLLATCDGMSITNSHGLGSQRDGFHPIQEALAENNGSQCGYCSTGMVVQMFHTLLNNDSPTLQNVEDALQGNICRCTGYRPILAAFRTFVDDSGPDARPSPIADKIQEEREAIESIRELSEAPRPLYLRQGSSLFFKPLTMADLLRLLQMYQGIPMRLVNNNTSTGVVKYYPFVPDDAPQVYINVQFIPELATFRLTNNSLELGAAIPINLAIDLLEANIDKSSSFAQLAKHWKLVATIQIRNMGVWVGNLMMAKTHPAFPSDLLLTLTAVGATITVRTAQGLLNVSMEEFFTMALPPASLIEKVSIPFAPANVKFTSFKIRQRDQNAHPIVNAAFRTEFTEDRVGAPIDNIKILYGGLQDGLRRASATESLLQGKVLDSEMTKQAMKMLRTETFATNDSIVSAEYRQNLAMHLFFKNAIYLQDPEALLPEVQSVASDYVRPVSQASQTFSTPNEDEFPVSFPVTHLTAHLQASGEAIYTDDIQPVQNSVWAAPVLSTRARAKIMSIDASPALALDGVIDFLSARDVAEIGGSNDIGIFAGDEELFASNEVFAVGQMIGVIITESHDSTLGERAALLVEVNYAQADEPPILSLQEGIAKQNYFEVLPSTGPFFPLIEQGDVDRGFAEADTVIEGDFYIESQFAFAMETMSAIALPYENDTLRVTCACQGAAPVNSSLATLLGMPQNKVIVDTRRCGGGYGSKLTRDQPLIGAVAVAARRLNRPVRCKQERVVDMRSVAGRHQYFTRWKVGYNDDGKIVAVDFDNYLNGGFSYDLSPGIVDLVQTFVDNAYNIPNFRTRGQLVRTNMPSYTAVRAPGHVQGPFIMENVIEHVSRSSGLDAHIVREQNFYQEGDITPYMQPLTDLTLDTVWEKLKTLANYDDKVREVEEFNLANKFRKRGLAMVPARFGLDQNGVRTAALVNIHGDDGSITVTTSGTEIGQGLFTKVAQSVAYRLGVSIETIKVVDCSTEKIPNHDLTGGSTGSEMCVQAALNACDKLNERLRPFRDENPDFSFLEIVQMAASNTDLSATGYFVGDDEFVHTYFVWTGALTVTEIDILTGETQILSSDIVYDGGIPLNPDVDIGQVEGAFVMGIGFVTTEHVVYNPDGSLKSAGTWEYKPPCSKTIPQNLHVTFLDNVSNPLGILGSKATGEPPLVTGACSVFFSIKSAIYAARQQAGDDRDFALNTPVGPEQVQLACQVTPEQLAF